MKEDSSWTCGTLEASIWKLVQLWRANLTPSTRGKNTVRTFALAKRWRAFSPDTFPNCCFRFSLLCLRLNNLFTPWHARCRVYSIKGLTATEEKGKGRREGADSGHYCSYGKEWVMKHKELPRLSILLWNAETLHYNKESLLQYFSSRRLLGLGLL